MINHSLASCCFPASPLAELPPTVPAVGGASELVGPPTPPPEGPEDDTVAACVEIHSRISFREVDLYWSLSSHLRIYNFRYGVFLNPGIWCLLLFPPAVDPPSGPVVIPELIEGVRLFLRSEDEDTIVDPLPVYGTNST